MRMHFFIKKFRQDSGRRRRDINEYYLKTPDNFKMAINRYKRSDNTTVPGANPDVFPENDVKEPKKISLATNDDTKSKMDPENRYYRYIYLEVNETVTSVKLEKLKHYTFYAISVKACREGAGNNCGMYFNNLKKTIKH